MSQNPTSSRSKPFGLLLILAGASLMVQGAEDTRKTREDSPRASISAHSSRSPIRFAGFVSLDGDTSVNLVDKRSGEAFWAKVGQTHRDITILEFSRKSRTVDIRVDGALLHLELSEAPIKRLTVSGENSAKFNDADIALAASQIVVADRMEEIRRRKASRAQDAAFARRDR